MQGVAVAQDRAERRQAAVDAGADAGVGGLAVLRVRRVHAARAGRQTERAAVRSEDGDLAVLGEVGAERGPEGVGVGGGTLPVEEAGEPAGAGGVLALPVRRRAGGPLGRGVGVAEGDHSGLGDPVHLVGADEDFGDLAAGTGDRGVQGLVEVELRYRDEVLELRDDRREAGVQLAEDGVAVGVLVHEGQHPSEVGAGELAAAEQHPVHGDQVPGPDVDFRRDARLAQHGPQAARGGLQGVGAGRAGGDQVAGAGVFLGMEDREDQVLQLALERLHAEPFGERDEDVAGDARDAGLLLGAHHAEGAHVVQPVGELDGHHADVVAGGDEHLAEGLRLGRRAVVDFLQLRDAVDQIAHLLAELLPHLIERHLGVLDRVVEQGGGQGGGLRAELGEDESHGERVGDVGLAALARLAAVRGLGEHVRLAQHVEVGAGVVAAVHLGDVVDGVGQSAARSGAAERRAPESPQIDAGAAAPAAESGVVRGLCAHAHLRQRRPAVGWRLRAGD